MDLIADILLSAGAIAAAFYCLVLGRRLKKFTDLEKGVGGAVAVLSRQVEDLNNSLEKAQKTAAQSSEMLGDLTLRAEETSRQLELQMASLHDVTAPKNTPKEINQALRNEEQQPVFIRRSVGG